MLLTKIRTSLVFFTNLLTKLKNENLDEEENIIVGGDFNCPLDTLLDKKGGIMIPRKSVVASIGCIQSELDLVDIWRVKNPSTKSYTWSQKSPHIFCSLDYWLISNNLHDLVRSVDIIPSIKTDHAVITLDLQNSDNEIKGPGFWKLNCALLEDDDYINDVSSKIPIWLAQGRKDLSDDRVIWDWLKYNIRAHAKQHSKRRAKERNEKENRLEEEYAKTKQDFETSGGSRGGARPLPLFWVKKKKKWLKGKWPIGQVNQDLLLVNLSLNVQMNVFKKVKCLFLKKKQS